MTRRPGDEGEVRELPLAEVYDEERVAATWQRIARSRTERGRGRAWVIVPVVAIAAAAAVVVAPPPVVAPGPLVSRDPAVTVAIGAVVEEARGAREVELDDGSRVVLEDDARLQVLANDGARFVALLDRGAARFEVRPGGPRQWTIETALATVEVVGTRFRVVPGAARMVVEVEEGIVVVRGDRVPGRVARVGAGEVFTVEHPVPAPVPVPVPVPDPVADGARTAQAPAGQGPGQVLSVSDALTRADALRADGDARAAAELLEAAVAADPDDPAAGLAAFTLGRLAADVLGDPRRAARAFARVIDAGSPTSLVEDAHARRVEALARAGDRDAARAALAAYERAYPGARRAARLRAELDDR